MDTHRVHWHEGQFLRPHHFQQGARFGQAQLHGAVQSLRKHHWGFSALDVDQELLANWRLQVRRGVVRLMSGLAVRIPEDVGVGPIEIPRDAFAGGGRVRVHLAVPRQDMGRANVGEPGAAARYVAESFEVDDENMPGNRQRVEVRHPNARLMLGEDQLGGFDAVPICQLRPAATAEPIPEVDPDYHPPTLSIGCWPSLLQRHVQPIFSSLSEVASRLASQMDSRGVAFESGHREDAERIAKLQTLNAVLGGIAPLALEPSLHPLDAYRELCRAVGLIAIFKPGRTLPELPGYDHDRLGEVFAELRRLLDLGAEAKRGYEKRVFRGEGLQMQVRLDREWLEPDWRFYVGVNSRLSLVEVDRLLRKQLDLKAGASDEVEPIFQGGRAGVHLNPAANPPRDFPVGDWSYWEINRDSPAWRRVEQSLHLAIRFNERQTMGSVDGKEEITVRNPDSGDLESLSLALFAIAAV